MSNKVETFYSENMYELKLKINNYCKERKLNPISISLARDGLGFLALVIMQEN